MMPIRFKLMPIKEEETCLLYFVHKKIINILKTFKQILLIAGVRRSCIHGLLKRIDDEPRSRQLSSHRYPSIRIAQVLSSLP